MLNRHSHTSDIAANTIRIILPQASPNPWRGGEGAEAHVVPFANGRVALKITLHKDHNGWWAVATFEDGRPIEEIGSSAMSVMKNLKSAILSSEGSGEKS